MRATVCALATLLALLASSAHAHSYVARPTTRSNQAATWRGELVGPCDSATAQSSPTVVARGSALTVEWPRNNHPGGMIRIAWAPTSNSNDPAAFRQYVQLYACHEYPCNEVNQCDNTLSTPAGCTSCSLSVAVPTFLTDGAWTMQWVWYGGGFGLSPYYSCVDYTVSGGEPAVSTVPQPTFVQGDHTSPSSCWKCSTCDASFDGGPTLAAMTAGNGVTLASRADDPRPTTPTPSGSPTTAPTTAPTPTAGPTPSPGTCPPDFVGFLCTAACSTTFYQCSHGTRYPDQAVAPGTHCMQVNGIATMVLASECTPGAMPSPTSSNAPSTGPTATTAPTFAPTSAPTQPPVGGPQQPKPLCTSASNGVQCFPSNCCRQFFQCYNGVAYPPQDVAPGTLCYGGAFVHSSAAECAGVVCGANVSDHGPMPTPHCGDGMCTTSLESCSTCPQDCGACPPRCGDGTCNGAETCATCAQDCGTCAVPTSTAPPQSTPPPSGGTGKRMVGYYTNWAQYRSTAGGVYKFFPEDIDAKLFTHLIYAFAKVDASFQVLPYEWNDVLDYTDGMYKRFHAHVRAQNPSIRTLYAVGGWNFNAEPATRHIMTTMLSSAANRASFINSAVAFARTHGFDGIDLDFEYPGDPAQGGQPSDKPNFTLLCSEFRTAIAAEAASSGKAPLLLTLAVGAGLTTIQNGYEVDKLHNYVDFINLMTYDLHGSWEAVTGAHTAIGGPAPSIETAVTAWLAGGMPPSKLVLGMATYGRSWTLSSPASHGIGAPASGPGAAGIATQSAGFLAYYEILALLGAGGTAVYDPSVGTMYAYHGTQWVSYDDERSVADKVALIYARQLGGAMVWALDLDDFSHGYPLCTAIAQQLYVSGSNTVTLVVRASSFSTSAFQASVAASLGIEPSAVRILDTKDRDAGETTVTLVVLNDYGQSKSANEYAAQLSGCNAQPNGFEIAQANGNNCKADPSTGTRTAGGALAAGAALIALALAFV